MPGPNRRVKIFNRVLKEFLSDYKKISNKNISFKANDISFLNKYREQVEAVKDDFFKCDDKALKDIEMCLKMDMVSTPPGEDKYNVWKYLHDLYIITLEKATEEVLEKSKTGLKNCKLPEKFSAFAKNLEKNVSHNTDFGNLIQDIAGQVSKSLEGKDLSSLNPMDLIAGLMSGNATDINGIDFSDIIKNTTETIQGKVESGELDINELQTQAGDIFKEL